MIRSRATVFAITAFLATGSSFAEGKPYTRNVAIVIWNGVEILDWGGPSEVFESASRFGQNGDEPAFNVYTVSKTKEPITSQRFISVNPQFSIQDAPDPDIVVFPGGGTGSVIDDPEFLTWAREAAVRAEVALSVCTGAFILGEAGILDNHTVTTWYGATDRLERTFPEANVDRGRRFVDNGQFITTAGVSAGIDGSLHLVARLLGRAVADRTAEYMEYRWTPEPYLAQSYSLLNPGLDESGRRLQAAGLDARAGNWPVAIRGLETHLAENPEDDTVRMQLGAAYYGAGDFRAAAELYLEAASKDTLRRRAAYNAACCYSRLEDVDRALELLSQAVDSGFRDRAYIMADDDLVGIRQDPRFVALMDSLR